MNYIILSLLLWTLIGEFLFLTHWNINLSGKKFIVLVFFSGPIVWGVTLYIMRWEGILEMWND